MNILKVGITGTLGTIIASSTIESMMKNYDTNVQPPIDKVSIIMPAYNEEEFIERSTISIKDQSIILNYPEYFEFIVVDNGSTDKTVESATKFADKVISAPKGKLTARNLGTDISNGNIIVAVDSDVFYPRHWLNTILKPFNDPSTVAVSGTILDYTFPNVPSIFYTIGSGFKRITRPTYMYGANCAYYKHLFYKLGKFNEKINQFNVYEMINEEEKNFGYKLSKFGNVKYKFNAACIHLGGQKVACRWGIESKKVCDDYKIGIERFG